MLGTDPSSCSVLWGDLYLVPSSHACHRPGELWMHRREGSTSPTINEAELTGMAAPILPSSEFCKAPPLSHLA